jgi:hypothetical protein
MHRQAIALAIILLCGWASDAMAADLAGHSCAALQARVDAAPGTEPVFLRSFDHADGHGPAAEPALNGAFSYDNAVAAIALLACGRTAPAARIGTAFLVALDHDRAGPHGRLRNAYRPGPVSERPVPPMGWWSAADAMWIEDPYQVGTATGNVAWVALALLTLHDATGAPEWRIGAEKLARWAVANTATANGFTGGIFGDGANAQPLRWKSTEHNIDLAAVFAWLARAEPDWHDEAEHITHGILELVWDDRAGRFATGTLPDGVTLNWATSGLDAQLWPVLLPDAPPAWSRAVSYAERAHGVTGGFDFNDDRDGLWVEGTAQAALAYRALGRRADAERLLAELGRHVSPGGFLWATREPQVTTGLAIAPDSVTDDFLYYRRPHLAATAWAALAGLGWNPFTGKPLP